MDGCDSLGLEWQNPNSNQIKQKQKTHNSYTYKGYWVAPNVKVALPEPGLRTRVQGHQTPKILSLFITFLAEWGRCLRLLALSSQFSSVSRKTSFSQGFHSKNGPSWVLFRSFAHPLNQLLLLGYGLSLWSNLGHLYEKGARIKKLKRTTCSIVKVGRGKWTLIENYLALVLSTLK